MKVHELKVVAKPSTKRVGRGIAAGQGKTAGRGTKGQKSRSGGSLRPGFEGGQNPLARRLPKKRGFKPLNRVDYQIVNLEDLKTLTGSKVDPTALREAGLIRHLGRPVKLLGRGSVTKPINLKVHAASTAGREGILKKGGKLELLPLPRENKRAKQE